MSTRRRAAAAGALATAPAIAVGWALSHAFDQLPFAPFALADRIVRITPGPVATAAIDRLHHAALPLLAGTVVAGFVGLGAVLAAVRAVGRWPAAAAGAPMAGALLAAALVAPVDTRPAGALAAAALGGALYALALAALCPRKAPAAVAFDPERRRALVAVAAATAGALLAADPLGRLVGARASRLRLLATAMPARRRPPFPGVAGLSPEVTSVADHYVVDIDIEVPDVDVGSWRLEVGGLVERPLRLGFEELQQRFALVEETAVLTCISNPVGGPLVGNSAWTGVRLRDVLAAARPSWNAVALAVTCADGYTAGIPLRAALHDSALVAVGHDGRALTREHGFPCRLRVPALYGMLNPKWVRSIELVDRPYRGYWAQQGWSATAVVRTASRIDTPRRARAGVPTWIAGVAWAGLRGIARVEVSLDDGRTWRGATLNPPLSPWGWTQWAYRWTPERPGQHALGCRATDGTGRVQDPHPRPPHPAGASGYHRVTLNVS
jgi:DMSO/TMAO reductase YedYZ molybdopterin-dependent catalytic subunit